MKVYVNNEREYCIEIQFAQDSHALTIEQAKALIKALNSAIVQVQPIYIKQ